MSAVIDAARQGQGGALVIRGVAGSGKSTLLADAVACARAGQQVPEGCHNVERMLGKLLRHGSVALCGTCMDARGMQQADMVDGASRSNLSELADWVLQADKVIVF